MQVREFIRHPISIPLDYMITGYSPEAERSLDLSVGGMSFSSKHYVAPGARLQLSIYIKKPPFEVEARVRWSRQRHDGGYDIGIQFANAHIAYHVRMIEQVCHIKAYQLRIFNEQRRVLSDEEAAHEWISAFADCFPENNG